ncbi:MAG TPA: C40 family peptidase, partial [Acidimicrobiales bacterium]|nr:C40 family peptidase [Acidimicrobiales bacterium]
AGSGAISAAPATLGAVVAIADPGPPPAATRAVQWALTQVGKPYVYGGTGPNGFDCSGLVMEAYAAAGIGLPRVAQDQYGYGPLVPAGAPLQPGDLVFFGTPTAITHDGIYIGDGMMVDAPHTGAFVRVEAYQWSDYAGATRPVNRAFTT